MEYTIINILCTGNPDHITVASAVKKCFPTASFASRATGYNFKLPKSSELFEKNIVDYNVFINSSYIQSGVQMRLLELAVAKWMESDVKGHIINIGTTAEWTENPLYSEYIQTKQQLRRRSLELNDNTGSTGIKTTYIIVGGVNDGKPGNENYLNVSSIAYAIEWALLNPDRIALIQIDVAK
jgi:hypothetical protein